MNSLIRSLGQSLRISNKIVHSFTRNISIAPASRTLSYTTGNVQALRPINARFSHSSSQYIISKIRICRM